MLSALIRSRLSYPAVLLAEQPVDQRYRLNTRACLSIRKWIEKEKLDAFSVNFLKACPAYGIDSMPFIEACKAMSRGIGYAGEGDALDAVFCGALIRAFGILFFIKKTSFP